MLFSFQLATTTCKVQVMFLLKTPFSSSHSRGSRWRRLTNFPVNSASIVAMLVKLLLVLIAWNISPATSLEVSFSRSKCALCCKRFSFNFFTFLLFSFSLCDFRSFQMWWKLPFQVYKGCCQLIWLRGFLKFFVEHIYSISFLSFLKIFQFVAYKGFWSMVFPIKDFSLAVDEW